MTFTVWLSLFTICILGAMSPGPSLAIVAKHALAGGRANGLATSWAHAFGIGIYAFVTLIGLAVVLQQSPLLFKTISYAGAGYLATWVTTRCALKVVWRPSWNRGSKRRFCSRPKKAF